MLSLSRTSALALALLTYASCTRSEAAEPLPGTATTPLTVTVPDARETLADLYALHARLFQNVTAEVTDEEATRRINGSTNSAQWIAGHTLDIQYNLAMLTGQATENPYAEDFAFGSDFDPTADYPSIEQMRADFDALAPGIEEAIRGLSDEQLAADSPIPLPFAHQTIQGVLAFQMHHLAYEIGQLGLYRRFLGKEAMSYQ